MALPAIPVIIKFLPKLLPAAKLAYDHRDKAANLYKNIQNWRKKDTPQSPASQHIKIAPLSLEEQIEELRSDLYKRDEIIAEQSDIVAKLANDLTELSTLTDRLRRRSQWLMRLLYLAIIIWIIRAVFF